VGQVHKIKPTYATPTFAHAVETFLVAHTAGGAWSTGTATKYRQTLTALAARLAGTRVGDDLATLDTDAGAARLAQVFTAAFGETAPRDPGPAPVHPALGHRLVARTGRLDHRRPDRELGTAEGRRRHHPGPDPRPGHLPVAPRHRDPGQDALAAALRDRRPH
jgi:hypothetical protein